MLFFFLQGYITHSNRISLHRAKFLANKFRISDLVYPLFEDNPRKYVYPTTTASPPYEPSSSSSSSPFTNKRSSLPSILDTGKITFSTTTPFQWLTHFYSCIPPLIACRLVTNHLMEKTWTIQHESSIDTKSLSDSNRSPTSILPLPRALQQQSNFPCLNYNYQEQRQPMDQSAALRALPHPASIQSATTTSHDQQVRCQ